MIQREALAGEYSSAVANIDINSGSAAAAKTYKATINTNDAVFSQSPGNHAEAMSRTTFCSSTACT